MSTVDIDLFGPPSEEDELHPEFAKVLLGFDPRHVEEFVGQAIERIVALETQLRETRSQLDQARAEIEAANQRSTLAREEAYGEVAGRMAELLRAADHYSEKLRRETEEACKRQLTEAGQEAEQIRREAEASADAHRAEAEAELRAARIEADEILGELAKQRDG